MADNQKGMTQAEYDELKAGLLQVFRENVKLDNQGTYSRQQTLGLAAAQAAKALIALEEHVLNRSLK
ncbi:MAG: hypothetical protein A3J37_03380 [Alphaproteobacteria bacterium RIFCSPHIGHO2_12_FULL_45_9]|nr:MAG: hypothetical protein A3B66_00990 [Alphaproteobacteria bacterium RIFCSPHIGHO2_02_FULL_46_13]OFW98477.1 MAG: hypothetical protein A3J37_03380 [Alphaproteobacteria bacterium RIFCSPHIGHO2_12_FULL_45_9]